MSNELEHIETFLKVNQADIPPKARAKARQSAARAILSDGAGIDTSMIPGHLRDAFRRLVIQAAYWKRSQGKRFDPDADYMPVQGGAKSSTINPCRI